MTRFGGQTVAILGQKKLEFGGQIWVPKWDRFLAPKIGILAPPIKILIWGSYVGQKGASFGDQNRVHFWPRFWAKNEFGGKKYGNFGPSFLDPISAPPGFLALLRCNFCVTRVGSFLCSESCLNHTNYLRFKSSCAVPAVSKVASYLQWAKCCRGNLSGKRPLFINMDETSFTFHYGKQKGLVVFFVSPKTRTVAVNMFFTCRTCSLCHLIHIDSTCCQTELQRKTYHLQLTPYFGPQFWHPARDHVFRF